MLLTARAVSSTPLVDLATTSYLEEEEGDEHAAAELHGGQSARVESGSEQRAGLTSSAHNSPVQVPARESKAPSKASGCQLPN